MWKMKTKATLVITGAFGIMIPKIEKWLQQIPGTTSEISIQKNVLLGIAKVLRGTLNLLRPVKGDSKLKINMQGTRNFTYIYIRKTAKYNQRTRQTLNKKLSGKKRFTP